jgi:hypothetical protein
MKLNTLKSIASLNLARGHYDLIKLSHAGFDEDYYLVNNTQPVEYDSQTWIPFPFGIVLEAKKDLTGASLVLGNVTRQIEVQLQKALSFPNESIVCEHIQITLERDGANLVVGLVSEERELELISPRVTKESITAGLVIRNSLPFNASKRTFNKNDFPNIAI